MAGQLADLPRVLRPQLLGIVAINARKIEARKAPVQRRVIESDPQPSLAHGLHVVGNNVAMRG